MKERKINKPIDGLSKDPYKRRSNLEIAKIVGEIETGTIGIRAASRIYGLCRNTLKGWMDKAYLCKLKDTSSYEDTAEMTNDHQTKILQQKINALTKALAQAELKVQSLETMIQVAEEDLHIKIKKKRGSKPSKD